MSNHQIQAPESRADGGISTSDRWSQWLFEHRFGRSESMAAENRGILFDYRGRVIAGARISPSDTVVDIGSGDGLIAFEALRHVGSTGCVVFTDISAPLLEHCREVVESFGRSGSARFVETTAATLEGVDDESADAVTSRSTLVYLPDKRGAVRSLARVLRPGGRLSILEPIARYGWQERSQRYLTWDMEAIAPLGDRLDEVFKRRDTSMECRYDLTERELVLWAEELGMREIHLDFMIDVEMTPAMTWETALEWSPNPCAPTLGQAFDIAFDAEERERVTEHLQPLIERGEGVQRQAIAHLTATK